MLSRGFEIISNNLERSGLFIPKDKKSFIQDNESLNKNYYKIGQTKNIDKRLKGLSNTSLPTPFNPFCCSGNVLAGTKGIHRQGDIRFAHINISTGIPEVIENPKAYGGGILPWLKAGSLTVFANSKQVGRVGDSVVCSSTIVTGDPTVLVGD